MASAEHLLHEAQYAFASISFGDTSTNKRHAARAKSLCRKIIQRYPASIEADEARAILGRLGEAAYSPELRVRHRHISQAEHHRMPPRPDAAAVQTAPGENISLDWHGLVSLFLLTPKLVLGLLAAAGVILFSVFGLFLFAPLLLLVLLAGPFRSTLNPAQRRQVEEFIARANEFIEERRRSGTGFA